MVGIAPWLQFLPRPALRRSTSDTGYRTRSKPRTRRLSGSITSALRAPAGGCVGPRSAERGRCGSVDIISDARTALWRTRWRALRRLRLPREDDRLEADEAHVGEQFAQGLRAGAAGVGELAFQHPSEVARGAGIRRGQMDDRSSLNTGSGRERGCLMLEPSSQRVPAPIAAWPTVDEDRVHASVSMARASVAMGRDVHQMVS